MSRRRAKRNKRIRNQQQQTETQFEAGRQELLDKMQVRRIHSKGGTTMGEALASQFAQVKQGLHTT